MKKMKNMISLMLALMLAVMPVLSLAEGADSLDSAIAAGKTLRVRLEPLINQELADEETAARLSAASLEMTISSEPAAQAAFILAEGDKTLGDLTIEAGEDGEMYIRSALLGGETLRIGMDEAELLIDKALGFMVSLGMLTQEDADTIRLQIDVTADAQQEPAEKTEEMEMSVSISIFELMTLNYGPLMDALSAIEGKIVHTKASSKPDGADEAAEYYGADLTGEDMAKLADGVTQLVASSKTLSKVLEDAGITAADIGQLLAAVKSLGVGAYFAGDGTLVHLTLLPVIAAQDGDYVGTLSYSRRSEPDKVTHTLDLGAALDPAEGEYTVLFNIPAALTLEENRAALTAELFGYTVEAAASMLELEEGVCSEVNMGLKAVDPMGETFSAKFSLIWNESRTEAGYPMQTYMASIAVNDDLPQAAILMTLSAEEPAGTVLADGAYIQPAQMTQEEFNAFAEALLMEMGGTMENLQTENLQTENPAA